MTITLGKYNTNTALYDAIDGVLQGVTDQELIDDSLDTITFVVESDTEDMFVHGDGIKLVIDSYSKCFIVSDIVSDEINDALYNKDYQYTITAIEPTKYLEKVICPAMTFTNKDLSLYTQIRRALINAEILEVDGTPRFSISSALASKISGIPGKDFFFDRGMTLREIMDGFLAAINCKVEVYEITDYNSITIDFYDLNDITELATSTSEIQAIQKGKQGNIEYVGSDIEAYADNAFVGSNKEVYHPSPNGWGTFQTEEAILDNNNATIKTEFLIEEITSFILHDFPYRVTWKTPDLENPGSFISHEDIGDLDIEIISNVVPDETYQILNSITGDVVNTLSYYKENSIYYNRGSDKVEATNLYKRLFFTTSNLKNVGLNAVYRWLYNYFYVEHSEIEASNIIVTNPIEIPDYTVFNALFRIKYKPYIDGHVKISKPKYDGIKTTITSNQSDRIVDLVKYGGNLYGLVQRLGNLESSFNKDISNITDDLAIGAKTEDGFVLVKKERSFFNCFIQARYIFSKDFNNINERIGIDRRKRIYSIPLENTVVDTLIRYKINASLTSTSDTSNLILEYIKTFNNITKNAITSALVQTSWYSEGSYIHSDLFELPLASYTMANAIIYTFKFQDNYSAGMSDVGRVIGGIKQTPNPYVNSIGEFDRIVIKLFNDSQKQTGLTFDQLKQLPKTNTSYYSAVTFLLDKEFEKRKDAYEHHKYSIEFETVSTDGDNLIVTDKIAQLNALFTGANNTLKVYYSLTERYSTNDKTALGTHSSTAIISTIGNAVSIGGVDILGENWSLIESIGIADSDGNLLIGINKQSTENIDTFVYFSLTFDN